MEPALRVVVCRRQGHLTDIGPTCDLSMIVGLVLPILTSTVSGRLGSAVLRVATGDSAVGSLGAGRRGDRQLKRTAGTSSSSSSLHTVSPSPDHIFNDVSEASALLGGSHDSLVDEGIHRLPPQLQLLNHQRTLLGVETLLVPTKRLCPEFLDLVCRHVRQVHAAEVVGLPVVALVGEGPAAQLSVLDDDARLDELGQAPAVLDRREGDVNPRLAFVVHV